MKKKIVEDRVAQARRRYSRAIRRMEEQEHCECCGAVTQEKWTHCKVCKVALVMPEEYHKREKNRR